MIRIVDIVLARRLAEASAPRALQGNVAITYEILIAPGSTVTAAEVQNTLSTMPAETLTDAFNKRVTDHTVTVTTISVSEPQPVGQPLITDMSPKAAALSVFAFFAAGVRIV